MKKLQFVLWIIVILAVLGLIGVLGYNFIMSKTEKIVHPEVSFEIENYGTIKMELYPEYAPNTVANFIKLVESGYYNNKVVYGKNEICLYVGRDSEGEIQNPTIGLISDEIEVDSEEDYEYSIFGEFIANGFNKNTLRHEKGIVSLIRNNYSLGLSQESYNSGNTQLGFMITDESNNLNGLYAAFGRIIEGLDILENVYNNAEIENSEDEEAEGEIQKFVTAPVITSTTVDTKGIDYGMPETQEAFDYQTYLNNYYIQNYSGN